MYEFGFIITQNFTVLDASMYYIYYPIQPRINVLLGKNKTKIDLEVSW